MFTRSRFTRSQLSDLERIVRDHITQTNINIMKELVKESRGDELASLSIQQYELDKKIDEELLKKIKNIFKGTLL